VIGTGTAARLGSYAVAAAVLATGAYALGDAVGPLGADARADGTHVAQGTHHVGSDLSGTPSAAEAHLPGGLQVSEDGYTLEPLTVPTQAGKTATLTFRVLAGDGRPVTRFASTHDRPLHLIVVRRDLTGYQHLHPAMSADGTWRVPLALSASGSYRAFADFRPADAEDGLTLGADFEVAGDYEPRALPSPSRVATVDGYTVTLRGALVPGRASELTLSVSRDGEPVTDLQPYLAAYGHLVALRHRDLAYLHVHPEGSPGDGRTGSGPDVTFSAEVPSPGEYRLFLDFKHHGVVRTAELTAMAQGTSLGEMG
jgi:hypothetical protein